MPLGNFHLLSTFSFYCSFTCRSFNWMCNECIQEMFEMGELFGNVSDQTSQAFKKEKKLSEFNSISYLRFEWKKNELHLHAIIYKYTEHRSVLYFNLTQSKATSHQRNVIRGWNQSEINFKNLIVCFTFLV